jgi:hypothetical protein
MNNSYELDTIRNFALAANDIHVWTVKLLSRVRHINTQRIASLKIRASLWSLS